MTHQPTHLLPRIASPERGDREHSAHTVARHRRRDVAHRGGAHALAAAHRAAAERAQHRVATGDRALHGLRVAGAAGHHGEAQAHRDHVGAARECGHLMACGKPLGDQLLAGPASGTEDDDPHCCIDPDKRSAMIGAAGADTVWHWWCVRRAPGQQPRCPCARHGGKGLTVAEVTG